MANSYVKYTGNGNTVTYSIPFGFLSREHIVVKLNGVETTDFSFTSNTQLTFDSAPAANTAILIQRVTPTEPFVDFADGAAASEEDLDNATKQAIYLAEETADKALVLDEDLASYDADSKRISNLATPTANTDAVTKAYVDAINTLLNAAISDLADDLQAAQIEAGNVPTPQPADDGKALVANADGTYDWQGIPVSSDDITDASAVGKAVLTANTDAAARSAINAAAASHTHTGADLSAINANTITTGTVNPSLLGSGTANANTYLAGDSSWKELSSGSKPAFLLDALSAIFPSSNFPQLVRNNGTNRVDFTLDFDKDTAESAEWTFILPTGVEFTGASIEIASRQSSNTNGTVGWIVGILAAGDGESWDGTVTNTTVTADTVEGTAGQIHKQSATLNTSGWTAGDQITVRITRDVANDNAGEDVKFMSAVLRLT